MVYAAVSRFWGSTAPSQPKESAKDSMFNRLVNEEQKNPFIHTLSSQSLGELRQIVEVTDKNGSPLAKKVEEAFTRTCRIDSTDRPTFDENSLMADPTFIHQGTLTQDELIKKAASEGSKWTKLSVNTLSDELLEIISTSCPNLETLVLYTRVDQSWANYKVSDKGVMTLAKLTKIKEFTFYDWGAAEVTEKGFLAILNNPIIQSQLTKLNLFTFQVTDSIIPVINGMKALKSLELWTCVISSTALATITLPNTIETLSLKQSSAMNVIMVDDNVLKKLQTFTSLKSLTVDCKMNCTEGAIVALFSSLSNLSSLSWSGIPISDTIAAAVPASLAHLSFGDASYTSDTGFSSLFQRMTSLVSLSLQKADSFGSFGPDKSTNNVKQLPRSLKHLYLHAPYLLTSLEGLPPNLTSLALQGPGPVNFSTYGNEISKLPLTTLRLMGCENFTDQQLARLANSPLANTLVNLEIVKSPLSPQAVISLEKFSKLKVLMLSLVGFDEEGASRLFQSNILSKQITHLYLNNFVLNPVLVSYLNKWPNLLVLFLNNLADLSAEHPFTLKNENITKHNGVLMTFAGNAKRPAFSFGQLLNAFGNAN